MSQSLLSSLLAGPLMHSARSFSWTVIKWVGSIHTLAIRLSSLFLLEFSTTQVIIPSDSLCGHKQRAEHALKLTGRSTTFWRALWMSPLMPSICDQGGLVKGYNTRSLYTRSALDVYGADPLAKGSTADRLVAKNVFILPPPKEYSVRITN